MRKLLAGCVVALAAAVSLPFTAGAAPEVKARTDATYYNDAKLPAADPYVLHDSASGYYYAYSTEGADDGWYFAIYRSADLATWQKLPGGALKVNDRKQWGNNWFWAPEVYHNAKTGLYYLFYAARSDANAKNWFGYANFEEPCKIGVAVSRSPAGPFKNIANHPIDYNPYDPNYHDVNLLMGPDQLKPPATLQQGETAPLGVYIPAIDPDVYFGRGGRTYLYFSRNAYRNWVWDTDLGKYIEESNIYAVQLTNAWWKDPHGRTMPTIAKAYRGANASPGGPAGPRRDGFVRILDYDHDKQAWENADVNDYALSNGQKKDRRWEEGSSILRYTYTAAGGARKTVYYLTYSANNWETPQYGVGYAVSTSPLGPFKKFPGNPILSQNAKVGMYSTGHGSFASSPDGTQLFYVHHGRPTPTTPDRRLYTERVLIQAAKRDPWGNPTLRVLQSTSDEPIPSGVAPYTIRATARSVRLRRGFAASLGWQVSTGAGTAVALSSPLNRVRVRVRDSRIVTVASGGPGAATLQAHRAGRTRVTLTYQRRLAKGGWKTVHNIVRAPYGMSRRTVSVTIPVTVMGAG